MAMVPPADSPPPPSSDELLTVVGKADEPVASPPSVVAVGVSLDVRVGKGAVDVEVVVTTVVLGSEEVVGDSEVDDVVDVVDSLVDVDVVDVDSGVELDEELVSVGVVGVGSVGVSSGGVGVGVGGVGGSVAGGVLWSRGGLVGAGRRRDGS